MELFKITPIPIFPITVWLFYVLLGYFNKSEAQSKLGENFGINLSYLCLAGLSFLPLLVIQDNPTGRIQAVLFVSFASVLYLFLVCLGKVHGYLSLVFGSLTAMASLLNSIYYLITKVMCPEKPGHAILLERGSNNEEATLHC
jgi:hypothetical protein